MAVARPRPAVAPVIRTDCPTKERPGGKAAVAVFPVKKVDTILETDILYGVVWLYGCGLVGVISAVLGM
jgi:hypothetical protein